MDWKDALQIGANVQTLVGALGLVIVTIGLIYWRLSTSRYKTILAFPEAERAQAMTDLPGVRGEGLTPTQKFDLLRRRQRLSFYTFVGACVLVVVLFALVIVKSAIDNARDNRGPCAAPAISDVVGKKSPQPGKINIAVQFADGTLPGNGRLVGTIASDAELKQVLRQIEIGNPATHHMWNTSIDGAPPLTVFVELSIVVGVTTCDRSIVTKAVIGD